MGMVSS